MDQEKPKWLETPLGSASTINQYVAAIWQEVLNTRQQLADAKATIQELEENETENHYSLSVARGELKETVAKLSDTTNELYHLRHMVLQVSDRLTAAQG
ncbi:hypothetical protein C8R43DRAFT_1123058 [Mycena crocata]|nr:hypothetical protein C8R43DRAFT_1123058 [Mycena crocata]